MREVLVKMSGIELRVEAPLAMSESEEFEDLNMANNNGGWSRIDNDANVHTSESDNNFGETFSGSLEDLVSTFDEKVTNCLKDFQETTENIAPVQRRLEDETIAECHQ